MHADATRFNAQIHALARNRRYQPIEGVQGFTRSHWTPSLGKYSGRIAPEGGQGQMPKKQRKSTILAGRFAGPVGASVRTQAHRPTEVVEGYQGSHWLTPPGKYGGQW
jgi:hypothetical protein